MASQWPTRDLDDDDVTTAMTTSSTLRTDDGEAERREGSAPKLGVDARAGRVGPRVQRDRVSRRRDARRPGHTAAQAREAFSQNIGSFCGPRPMAAGGPPRVGEPVLAPRLAAPSYLAGGYAAACIAAGIARPATEDRGGVAVPPIPIPATRPRLRGRDAQIRLPGDEAPDKGARRVGVGRARRGRAGRGRAQRGP